MDKYPAGVSNIFKVTGTDATISSLQFHLLDLLEKIKPHFVHVGKSMGNFERTAKIRADVPALKGIFNFSDFKGVSKHVLPPNIYAYCALTESGEFTLLENLFAYEGVFFRPGDFQGIDLAEVDCKTSFLRANVDVLFYITGLTGSLLVHLLNERNLQVDSHDENVI